MKIRVVILFLTAFIFALVAFSCGEDEDDESKDYGGDGLCDACLGAAPDMTYLQITVPGYTEQDTKALGDMAEYYDMTVDVCRGLNNWVLGYLGIIDEILSYPPTSHDSQYCIWGPFTDPYTPPTSSVSRFMMRQQSTSLYDYYYQERPKDSTSDDDWQNVWEGDIEPSTSTSRRGVGNMFIDHTLAQQLDPTRDSSGQVEVEYDTFTNDARAIDITFTNFAFDDNDTPFTGTYHYYNDANDDGEFQFILQMDFDDPESEFSGGALETWSFTTTWVGSGRGEAEVTIGDGDITGAPWQSGTVDHFLTHECWNDNFARVYLAYKLILDDGTELEYIPAEGNISDCPFSSVSK